MSSWDFHNPVYIHFGRDRRGLLVDELKDKRCLVVTTARGRRRFSEDPLLAPLAGGRTIEWADSVTPNPGIAELQQEIDRLRGRAFDAIIGFGGGSAMDSAKVLSVALARDLGDIPLTELLATPALHENLRTVPHYAVPTTAGTGSEVTPFATVWDHETKRKYSLAGEASYPHTAVVDPALTDGLPKEITLSTGLDAINQASESIWNRNATPVSLELAMRAIRTGFQALPRLLERGDDRTDRNAMAECSLLAGMAISQTRTALCHSISYPITAHFGVPHGLACAFTMREVLQVNLAAEDGRFLALAKALFGADATLEDLRAGYDRLHEALGISGRVRALVPDEGALLALAEDMYTPGRADNNLVAVTPDLIRDILKRALLTP